MNAAPSFFRRRLLPGFVFQSVVIAGDEGWRDGGAWRRRVGYAARS